MTRGNHSEGEMLTTVLIIVLILLLIGAIPGAWGHTKDWGPAPAGTIVVILVIVVMFLLLR